MFPLNSEVLSLSGYQLDVVCSPGDKWQYLETFLIIAPGSGGVGGRFLLTLSRERPEMLLNFL